MITWHTNEPPPVTERFQRLAQRLHISRAAQATATWEERGRVYGVQFVYTLDEDRQRLTIAATLQVDLPTPTNLAHETLTLQWAVASEDDAAMQWYMIWQRSQGLLTKLSAAQSAAQSAAVARS